ncbi:MAG: sigma-70 family RNA polymerase sigma factor [Candidatus Limnocylindrales bacterium]
MSQSGSVPATGDDTTTTPTDEDLLLAAAQGDPEAIGRLYDRHQGTMYGLAIRITDDAGLAQDVVQEAMLGVWRNASRFDPARAKARTWMLALVHHRAIDALRRRRASVALPEPDVPPPAALVVPDIWDDVVGRLDAMALREALGRVPAAQREVLELAYFAGRTQQEIASQVGIPLGTVKSRVRLGLLALRAELGGEVSA